MITKGLRQGYWSNFKIFKAIKKFWPQLVLLLVSLLFFYPVNLQGKIPLPLDALVGAHIPWTEYSWEGYPAGVPIKNQEITDAISQFYPWKSLVGEFWRNGKFPLWNFFMFNGTPFLATLHSAALYPLNALYLLFSDQNAWTMLLFLQILLAGIFMYLLLRDYKLSNASSYFGAIAFSLSGYMIAWLEFGTGGQAGLWLPLLLLVEKKFIDTGRRLYLFFIPFVFFLIFTAGDFQVPSYISATYFLYGLYRIITTRNKKALFTEKLFPVFTAFVFAVLLSSIQLIPTIELFKNSVRANDPYIEQYFYGLMNWEKVTNFIWPDFFGNIVTRNYWSKYGFHEYISYIGIISLVFVFYSLLTRKIKEERFFLTLLVITLLFLFPTPIAFLPYKLKIPAIGTSSASRIIFLVDFALSALAAFGIHKYLREPGRLLKKIIFYLLAVTLGLSIGFVISYYLMNDSLNPVTKWLENIRVALRNMVPGTLFIISLFCVDIFKSFFAGKKYLIGKLFIRYVPIIIILLSTADLLRFAWKNTPFSEKRFLYPKVPIIDYLQKDQEMFRIAGGIPTNLFMPYKLFSAEGYDPIYPARNGEWYSLVDWGHTKSLTGRYGIVHYYYSPLINYANVKYIVDYKKDDQRQIDKKGHFYPGIAPTRYTEDFHDNRVYVFKNNDVLPYIWLTRKFEVAKDSYELIDKLLSSSEPKIILEKNPGLDFDDSNLDYEVANVKKLYNEIEFDVVLTGDSLAFVSESYYPGWRAYIDGSEEEVLRANWLFQSIKVPRGEHKIRFVYFPKSFKIGLWLSLTTFIFLIWAVIYELRHSKKSKRLA